MTPFDPILRDHEKRLKMLEASRRDLEDQMVVMAAMERKHAATVEVWEEFLAQQIQYEIDQKKRDEEWKAHHELAMKEFDDKLNGLIGWLDEFVKHNPKNGK
jgi:soluble cytochrome b562